jgi:hypothetical protein
LAEKQEFNAEASNLRKAPFSRLSPELAVDKHWYGTATISRVKRQKRLSSEIRENQSIAPENFRRVLPKKSPMKEVIEQCRIPKADESALKASGKDAELQVPVANIHPLGSIPAHGIQAAHNTIVPLLQATVKGESDGGIHVSESIERAIQPPILEPSFHSANEVFSGAQILMSFLHPLYSNPYFKTQVEASVPVFQHVISKPPPSRVPPVWADTRQELCEGLSYFKSYQSGVYVKNGIAFGYLLDQFGAERDFIGSRVVISHGYHLPLFRVYHDISFLCTLFLVILLRLSIWI